MKNKSYLLELVVFSCGAIVMIFELVGARVLGPYFGTSFFVWTAIIGVILGSLSLGYYLGGKIADKRPSVQMLSSVIFVSALLIALSYFFKEVFLIFLSGTIKDAKMASVIATVVLFSPASVFLGMVSPYAVKLRVDSLKTTGAVVGRLYSLSTLGSIFGTFLAGFYLIPSFGTNMNLIILTVFLFFLSFLLILKKQFFLRFAVVLVVFSFFYSIDFSVAGRIDVDTPYNRVWIYDYKHSSTGKITKIMGINNENHSSMFLDSDELVNVYTKYYDLINFFKADFENVLMLGGAAYSYPKYFVQNYLDSFIDVVEIDPKMTELARKYFRLEDNDRMQIFHEDGRVFLNNTSKKYDAILGDAFGSRYSVPYQLTTLEAVEKKYNALTEDGVVILNLISSFEGQNSMFLRAQYRTYKEVFPKIFLFKVNSIVPDDKLQNIILVAFKKDFEKDFSSASAELLPLLNTIWKGNLLLDLPILTDDFAPVEYYMNNANF